MKRYTWLLLVIISFCWTARGLSQFGDGPIYIYSNAITTAADTSGNTQAGVIYYVSSLARYYQGNSDTYWYPIGSYGVVMTLLHTDTTATVATQYDLTVGLALQLLRSSFTDSFDVHLYHNTTFIDTSVVNDSYGFVNAGLTAYITGMRICVKISVANTDAATLQINSLGAKAIKKRHDTALATGDIEAGQFIDVVYDGTNFQMLSQLAQ